MRLDLCSRPQICVVCLLSDTLTHWKELKLFNSAHRSLVTVVNMRINYTMPFAHDVVHKCQLKSDSDFCFEVELVTWKDSCARSSRVACQVNESLGTVFFGPKTLGPRESLSQGRAREHTFGGMSRPWSVDLTGAAGHCWWPLVTLDVCHIFFFTA